MERFSSWIPQEIKNLRWWQLPRFIAFALWRIMSTSDELVTLATAIKDEVATFGPTITEVGAKIDEAIGHLNQDDPNVANALSQLQAAKTALDDVGAGLSGLEAKFPTPPPTPPDAPPVDDGA